MLKKFGILGVFFVFTSTGFVFAEEKSDTSAGWKYKLSAEERLRYEYKQNFDFNKSAEDNGGQFYHRLRLGAGASLAEKEKKPKLDLFVEGLDAQTGGYQIKANAGQTDDFDLHQAYFNLHDILGSDFDLKGGRQEVSYGKGRLLGAPTWSNRIRAFDGAVVHYHHAGLWADALYAQDVKYDDDKINESRSEEFLSGIYGGYQKEKSAPNFESYFLRLSDTKGTNDIHRYTVGSRIQKNFAGDIALDIEAPIQFGKTGTTAAGAKDIHAYAFHMDVSKSFKNAKWKPLLAFAYDEASGDKDPNDGKSNTFVPLYQSTHTPYGQMDLFRWQNVRNPEIYATFSPAEKFKFTPQVDFFWLQSKSDSWYSSSGSATRTKTGGDRNYYVGSELSLRANYDFTKNIKWETAYAHFFTGGFVKDTGADDDADWVYTQMTLKY